MNDLTVMINDRPKKVPYRIYRKPLLQFNRVKRLCLLSRYHDGHIRAAALKELITLHLPALAVPYVYIALADYVIEISTIPLDVTEELKEQMESFVKANPDINKLIESIAISYWNEYYRDKYATYQDYPPYSFLRTLDIS